MTIAPGDDAVTSIAETLASRDVLLVLDTCEHVVAAVAPAGVGRACARQPMCGCWRRAGERSESRGSSPGRCHRWTCRRRTPSTAAEITSHAAVPLFVERATAVWPDLDVDDTVAADIAAVCVALDGLPLAIELAAARTDVLSPAAIRSRLEDRFGLLVDGGADVAERQQTLRARDRLELRAAVGRPADVLRPPRRVRRHVSTSTPR